MKSFSGAKTMCCCKGRITAPIQELEMVCLMVRQRPPFALHLYGCAYPNTLRQQSQRWAAGVLHAKSHWAWGFGRARFG